MFNPKKKLAALPPYQLFWTQNLADRVGTAGASCGSIQELFRRNDGVLEQKGGRTPICSPSPLQPSRLSNPSPGSFNNPSPRQEPRPSNPSPGSFNNPSPCQEPRPSNPSPGSFNNPFINGSNNAQCNRRSAANILSSIEDCKPAILQVKNIVMPHWRRMEKRAQNETS
jgi:hypothetical protein